MNRQIFLDIETTGMQKFGNPYEGHKIIEIGAVEVINRTITGNYFHVYIQPNRLIDLEAFNVHGISDEFLIDKPSFSEIKNELFDFIKKSELIIHNASFDVGFINYELSLLNISSENINDICQITDSLKLARKLFPNKRNSLDALCKRFLIKKNHRTLHGALLDAEILANVFLLMTRNQNEIHFSIKNNKYSKFYIPDKETKKTYKNIRVIYATEKEVNAHKMILNKIYLSHGNCIWKSIKEKEK